MPCLDVRIRGLRRGECESKTAVRYQGEDLLRIAEWDVD